MAWSDEDDTLAFAQDLAARPAIERALIELRGDLGAGKTTFVRHLLRSLGVEGRIKSPTYAVVETYALQGTPSAGMTATPTSPSPAPAASAWHFDFYRFNDPREWEEAGLRDIFASTGLKLVEWPDKAGPHLPPPDLVIAIELQADESREVTLTAGTPLGAELLA